VRPTYGARAARPSEETGTKVKEVARQLRITEQIFYRWKREFGGLGPSELRRLRLLEDETRRLKKLIADLSLDNAMLQEVIEKKLRRSHNVGL
jgi:putative transposase